jgi:predicted DNA-binding transcriptional regulator YafY
MKTPRAALLMGILEMKKNADGSGKLAAGASRQNRARRRSLPPPEAPEALSRVPKTERILNLVSFLLHSKSPISVEMIMSKVKGYDDAAHKDSLMRRFERDKKVLREMGIPLHFRTAAQGLEGYFIDREAYYLKEITLPKESLVLLQALADAATRHKGGQIREDLRSALLKLGFDSAPLPLKQNHSIHSDCLDLKLAGDEGDYVKTLSEAVLRRQRVRFTYYTIGRDATTQREVDPYGLGFAGQGWHKGSWYLVAFCHSRQSVRVFKVPRIQGQIELLPFAQGQARHFEFPEHFQVGDYIAKPLWEFDDLALPLRGKDSSRCANQPEARIKVSNSILSELRELIPAAKYVDSDDDHMILDLPVVRQRPFLRFLLRYSDHIEILDPPELRDSLKKLATEALQQYRGRG